MATSADLLAAFIQPSGLELLIGDIEDALRRGARIRVLTGDFLNITHADALRSLLGLSNAYAECEAYFHEGDGESFHPKAYIFTRGDDGAAYVGSSNISSSALGSGVEWNLRLVSSADAQAFATICARFDGLLRSRRTQKLTADVIAAYELRAPVLPSPAGPEPRPPPPTPNLVQLEALDALRRTRQDGHTRGLVVLATGLGKTYLAAFDCRETRARRALFIAHREEILTQAMESWAKVFPDRTFGILGVGKQKVDVDMLFASVQTLSRERWLSSFDASHFDYVVVDEFHHASAQTYRKVLNRFHPDFMLGLTATPDRMDGKSLLELCHDNLVYSRNLVFGVTKKLLVPFSYFGVKDAIGYEPIPWRNSGKFDTAALTTAQVTQAHGAQALREFEKHAPTGQRRALVFCSSTRHADFIAKVLILPDHFCPVSSSGTGISLPAA